MSPDGTRAIFICDWNIWVKDIATGQERQLTTDGEKNFGYATSNAGWTGSAMNEVRSASRPNRVMNQGAPAATTGSRRPEGSNRRSAARSRSVRR